MVYYKLLINLTKRLKQLEQFLFSDKMAVTITEWFLGILLIFGSLYIITHLKIGTIGFLILASIILIIVIIWLLFRVGKKRIVKIRKNN